MLVVLAAECVPEQSVLEGPSLHLHRNMSLFTPPVNMCRPFNPLAIINALVNCGSAAPQSLTSHSEVQHLANTKGWFIAFN